MDKVKIGAFISKCRRDKCLTQEQLAEQLNVTNKAISKWETGNCLPDASLYEPLCHLLGISIGELFAGCRLPDQSVAESNLLRSLIGKLYDLSDKSVSIEAFNTALIRISELSMILKSFGSKEEAVSFMIRETGFSHDECSEAFEFYTHLLETPNLSEVT